MAIIGVQDTGEDMKDNIVYRWVEKWTAQNNQLELFVIDVIRQSGADRAGIFDLSKFVVNLNIIV